jgi:hypothetical protein
MAKKVNQVGPKPRPKSGMMNEMMGRMIDDPGRSISDADAAELMRMARRAAGKTISDSDAAKISRMSKDVLAGRRVKNFQGGGEVNPDLGGFILDSYLGGVRQKDLRPQKIGSPPAKKSSSGATMPGRGGKFKGTK